MKKIFTAAILAAAVILSGCSAKSSKKTIAVFVPGIMADSPTYAKLAQGVKDGVEKYNSTKPENEKAEVFIMEAGTNQAEWGPKILSLAAAQKYDLIVSSNPSIPALVEPITKQFPKQKFILLDGDLSGNGNVHTVSYDQTEQAYFSGYMAGLVSKNHKVALIAAQEYPIMNEVLYPNFAKGAQDAFPGTTSEFRVVGNWYDANKGMEISDNLIANGVDAILPICGGAAQGVIASAVNHGTYITWMDSIAYSRAPGTIVSCVSVQQNKMAASVVFDYLEGKTPWGTSRSAGFKDGVVVYEDQDPVYIETVPEEIRAKMAQVVESRR